MEPFHTGELGPDDLEPGTWHHSHIYDVVRPREEKSHRKKKLIWPPAPARFKGNGFFTCPYCKVSCPESYLSKDNWRTHQIHDLKPYQCTYEDCSDPHRLYGRLQDWIDHENLHRRVWHCYTHQEEFETLSAWQLHANEKHPGEDHLSPEWRAASFGSSSQPRRVCPLCPTRFSDPSLIQQHMQYHLEQLALYVLPDAKQDPPKNRVSMAHNKQVAEHRGWRDPIISDFSEWTADISYGPDQRDPIISDFREWPAHMSSWGPDTSALYNSESTPNPSRREQDDSRPKHVEEWLSQNNTASSRRWSEYLESFSTGTALSLHTRRHTAQYRCTWYGCKSVFGNKKDWMKHEHSRHIPQDTWNCAETGCNKYYGERHALRTHLKKEHGFKKRSIGKEKLETCRKVGYDSGRPQFWCGFCAKLIEVTDLSKRETLWARRFGHFDGHIHGINGLEKGSWDDWQPDPSHRN
jgi:hypothetical protein